MPRNVTLLGLPLFAGVLFAAVRPQSPATTVADHAAPAAAHPAAGFAAAAFQPASFSFPKGSPDRSGGESAEPAAPLSLTASDGTGLSLVALEANGVLEPPLAFTELHLTFDNPRDRIIEGHFRISLPPGAALSRFAMKSDGGWQEGEVVERQRARVVYEDYLHRRQDPPLLEQDAGNQFSARVFPIPARGRKELIVSYSHALTRSDQPYVLPLQGLCAGRPARRPRAARRPSGQGRRGEQPRWRGQRPPRRRAAQAGLDARTATSTIAPDPSGQQPRRPAPGEPRRGADRRARRRRAAGDRGALRADRFERLARPGLRRPGAAARPVDLRPAPGLGRCHAGGRRRLRPGGGAGLRRPGFPLRRGGDAAPPRPPAAGRLRPRPGAHLARRPPGSGAARNIPASFSSPTASPLPARPRRTRSRRRSTPSATRGSSGSTCWPSAACATKRPCAS